MKRLIIMVLIVLSAGLASTLIFRCWKTEDPRSIYEKEVLALAKDFNSTNQPLKDQESLDEPDAAAFQNYLMTMDPVTKTVPQDRLYSAYRMKREMMDQEDYKSSNEDMDWTEVPSNMGGRTRAIMWDPNDPSGYKVWGGGVTGGLWYNEDISDPTSQWQAVNDYWPSLSVACMAYDPNDPMTFYVGTGEYQTARLIYRESSGVGIGIWKSEDGGETWDLLPSTADFKYISDIKIRSEEGVSVIYASVVSGYYHGINQQSQPTDGLYRSEDGGETWQQVLPDIAGETVPYAPADLELSADQRIFVGTMKNLDGHGGATILYSDDGTPGSWTVFDNYEGIIQNDPQYPVPGRVIVACAPSNANIVYALVGAGWYDDMGGNRAEGRYILKSTNAGTTWSQLNLPDNDPGWASLSWHAFVGAVNPSNSNDVFVGGLDVWKTSNGGNNWSKLSDWAGMYWGGGDDYVHADQHVQVYKPGSSNEMLLGSDGGVFYTGNASSSNVIFQEKNNHYCTLQYYTCDIYPVAGQNYFVGGLQDNGTLLYMGDPLDINDMIDGGDGAYSFFDKNEPQVMITSVYYNSYSIFLNWEYYTDAGIYNTGVFVNPADYDSQNNILFANGVTFSGSNANKILRISGIPYNTNDQMISLNTGLSTYFSAVTVSPYTSSGTSTIYLGTLNGRLFKVTNAQSSPVTVEIGSNDFPVAYISSVALAGSEDTLMVTFSNYGVPSVWQTYDGGNNWTDVSGNLPDMPIRWALYHPESANQVMLATELGIWTTTNTQSGQWTPDPLFPNVRVDMVKIRPQDNLVVAATHGRGLMYGTWNYNPPTGIRNRAANDFKIFPNPASDFIIIKNTGNSTNPVVRITDTGGSVVFSGRTDKNGLLDISKLTPGIYFAEIEAGNQFLVKKFLKN